MKILVVQDYLRSGGTERQSILLSGAFAAAGHACTLLTFRPGGPLAGTINPAVARDALQPCDTRLDWFAPDLSRTVARIAPDVVLCMGRMANCYAGRLQERFPRIAVVSTLRTGKPLPLLFRRSLFRVSHIVANSHDAKARLVAQQNLPEERISVIHNSLVFPPAGSPTRNVDLRARFGAGRDTVVLLCVAMFRPEKNQRELIEIAAALPVAGDWQLWLAGDGPTLVACQRLVQERELESRVKFLGYHSAPPALYAAAEVAVHASRTESLSNFLIEAQAHGLPAVVYAAQGIEECFVSDETGWVVPAGDRAGFVARLQTLLASRELRHTASARARAFAAAEFDADRQPRAYLDLFAQLVQTPVLP